MALFDGKQIAFETGAYWIDEIDTGTRMAKCSACGSRNVVGLYCYKPYPWSYCYGCGSRMFNAIPPRMKRQDEEEAL